MLPPPLRSALVTAQLVGAATIIRSVAFDRWITVLAAAILVAGAVAAERGRTWGIALSLAAASAFPVAWLIGIAPMWFCFVGVAGAMPFLHALPAFKRFDRGATATLAAFSVALGAGGAILWKNLALSVFSAVPLLRPSIYPHHGIAIAMLVTLGIVLTRRKEKNEAHVRVGEGVRVASITDSERELLEEEPAPPEALPEGRRLRL